ncbi:MAG: type IV pilus assembly protein PilM [Candidatus Omnitrophica bacterium]|nr:type IV pilus assembly protein PilM [Candidatus Omnitrophota bacterium]
MKHKRLKLNTGIDIGSSSIKIVQLSGNADNPVLMNFDIVKVGEKTADGYVKELVRMAGKYSFKEANIAISGPSVVVRYVELPEMTEDEMKSSMRFEAEKHIPFDLNDVNIDCQIIEQASHGKMQVLLVAAKKIAISELVKMSQRAGLTLNIIDCDSFALINAFLLTFPDLDTSANTALIHIGDNLTMINILKGRYAAFTRELEMGGIDIDKAISEKLNLGLSEAAEFKENPGDRYNELMEMAKPILANMIEEVKLSLSFYENQAGISVNKILLSGGLSNLKGLTEIFAESFGVECSQWGPFRFLKADKDIEIQKLRDLKAELPIAVGLAVRR